MIVVIGAGAFGTALAEIWAAAGQDVTLLGRRDGIVPPPNVEYTTDRDAVRSASYVVLAVPAQATASVIHDLPLGDAPIVLTAKGITQGSLLLQSEVLAQALPEARMAVLTGPSFAGDIRIGKPTALILAAQDLTLAKTLAQRLTTPTLRLYLSDDMIGAQFGGALKNIIAIACGAAMGAGLGESARAALMTRGLAEMTRLAVAAGGRTDTLSGLSGLGDLALTALSKASRNYRAGYALGQGHTLPDGTVEGAASAAAAVALAARYGIDMPITQNVAALLGGGVTVSQVMDVLLSRPAGKE